MHTRVYRCWKEVRLPQIALNNILLKVEQLIAVTGVAKEIATNLLEACGGNLEMAVRINM